MKQHFSIGTMLAGFGAGVVNGLFGAGGGMVLVPLLGLLSKQEDRSIFSSSVAIILPICLVSLTATVFTGEVAWLDALPWLPGSAIGGYLAAKWGHKIPSLWLHRSLGLLIIYGGVRYLC